MVAAKIGLTALCVAYGFAGGVFSPALLIGILFGALFWTIVDAAGFVPHSGVAVYAICGMMAVTSPVIGAPLTTILIVFELTRNYDLTIAAMVAVVFSNLIAHKAFGRSLFDVQLAKQGIDLSNGRDRARLEATLVLPLAAADPPIVAADAPPEDVVAEIKRCGWSEAFLVDRDGRFQGVARAHEGKARPAALALDPNASVFSAMRALDQFVGDAVTFPPETGAGGSSDHAAMARFMSSLACSGVR